MPPFLVLLRALEVLALVKALKRVAPLLTGGVSHDAALTAYRRGRKPKAPCGRYGATAVQYHGSMYLFGGTDGGYSKHGEQDYRQGRLSPAFAPASCVTHTSFRICNFLGGTAFPSKWLSTEFCAALPMQCS